MKNNNEGIIIENGSEWQMECGVPSADRSYANVRFGEINAELTIEWQSRTCKYIQCRATKVKW